MAYIKASDDGLMIPNGYEQSFQFSPNIIADRRQVLKLIENGNVTKEEMSIMNFLLESIFATQEQLERYCKLHHYYEDTENGFRTMIKHLMATRLVNRFMLGDRVLEKDEHIPSDARSYYCAGAGAAKLMEHYTTSLDVLDWQPADVQKASGLIARNIYMTELHLRLEECCPGRLSQSETTYFRMVPKFTLSKTKVFPAADFRIGSKNGDKAFVCDVFLHDDKQVETQERLNRIESVLTTQAWKKYYPMDEVEPVFIAVTDSDETALHVAKLLSDTTKIEKYRFTTTERMQKPLGEKGAFLKYDDATGELEEVKAGTFSPQ